MPNILIRLAEIANLLKRKPWHVDVVVVTVKFDKKRESAILITSRLMSNYCSRYACVDDECLHIIDSVL